jgi:hypothetical protein
MTKEILSTLKGAKVFLETNQGGFADGFKATCICYAISDYLASVYGTGQAHREGTEAWDLREAAQGFVRQELAKLTDKAFFDYEAAAKAFGREERLDLQEARHLWLDQLIKELEQ